LSGSDVEKKIEPSGTALAATDRAAPSVPTRESDYVAWLTPRIPGQPWTAPAYDRLSVPMQAPRVFCMASGHDGHDSCTCLSEQGTRYVIEPNRCRMIALQGQYEPFLDEVQGDRRRLDDATQLRRLAEQQSRGGGVGASPLRLWPRTRPLLHLVQRSPRHR
jgi:hypothetical protein